MEISRPIARISSMLFMIPLFGLISCNLSGKSGSASSVAAKLSVVSVTPTGTTAKGLSSARALFGTKTGFTNVPTFTDGGYIISGTPDYLKVTLTQILVRGTFSDGSTGAIAWTGTQSLTLDGVTPIDTSGIIMTIPTGTITEIDLNFDPKGFIKGTLNGSQVNGSIFTAANNGSPQKMALYTKAAYAYDGTIGTGGASSYINFTTGPAEEAPVTINLGAGTTLQPFTGSVVVPTPANLVVATGDSPTLTILVDLSRMLRFYDGLGRGVNPSDPKTSAYFFSHTVFSQSIAAFFGTPGAIQGYSAKYAEYPSSSSGYPASGVSGEVDGWMTLIFATDGSLISGILSENDDNALTVGKGWIGQSIPTPGAAGAPGVFADLPYSLPPDTYHLLNFVKGSAIGDNGFFDWNSTAMNGMYGEVEYTLLFTN